ncbi:MAG: terminase gpA endonuclease subunit, partial [Pseudomonadota bacterium]
ECQLVAHGRDNRSHTVDYIVIPHHIGTDECRAELDKLLKRKWRNAHGRDIEIDRLAIDGGSYTDDVWDWAKRWPWNRVIITKGASSATGPLYQHQKFERRRDGRAKRRHQKRAYLVNVSALKATLYADLKKQDPAARGYQSFAAGLGDHFYKMLCSERRILKRNRHGVIESAWVPIQAGGPNEALDNRIMADVAARLEGSRSNTEADWDALEAARDCPPEDSQRDLFDRTAAEALPPPPPPPVQSEAPEQGPQPTNAAAEEPGNHVAALFSNLRKK